MKPFNVEAKGQWMRVLERNGRAFAMVGGVPFLIRSDAELGVLNAKVSAGLDRVLGRARGASNSATVAPVTSLPQAQAAIQAALAIAASHAAPVASLGRTPEAPKMTAPPLAGTTDEEIFEARGAVFGLSGAEMQVCALMQKDPEEFARARDAFASKDSLATSRACR